jgi:hypothetical protein
VLCYEMHGWMHGVGILEGVMALRIPNQVSEGLIALLRARAH